MNVPDSLSKHDIYPAPKSYWRFVVYASAAFIFLYTIIWYLLSSHVQQWVEERLKTSSSYGIYIYCENLHKTGFPIRIGSACDTINYQWPTAGLAFSSNGFEVTSPIFAPQWRQLQVTSPATAEVPGIIPVGANWQKLQIDSEFEKGNVTDLKLLINHINMHNFNENRQEIALLKADFIRLASKIHTTAMHINLTYDQLLLPSFITSDNTTLPAISGNISANLYEPYQLLRPSIGAWSNRFRSTRGYIENASINFETGGQFIISGNFYFSQDGYLNGKFSITFVNIADLNRTMRNLYPSQSSNISSFFFAINALPKDSKKNPVINFTVSNGTVHALFFEIGKIPPL